MKKYIPSLLLAAVLINAICAVVIITINMHGYLNLQNLIIMLYMTGVYWLESAIGLSLFNVLKKIYIWQILNVIISTLITFYTYKLYISDFTHTWSDPQSGMYIFVFPIYFYIGLFTSWALGLSLIGAYTLLRKKINNK